MYTVSLCSIHYDSDRYRIIYSLSTILSSSPSPCLLTYNLQLDLQTIHLSLRSPLSPEDSRQSVQYYVNVSSSSGSSRRGPEKSLMENKVRNVDINLAAGSDCFYTFCSSSLSLPTQRDVHSNQRLIKTYRKPQ